MWATLLAGSFGILGVAVGQVIGRRSEHQKWLRDQRLAAYADVLLVAGEFTTSGVLRDVVHDVITPHVRDVAQAALKSRLAELGLEGPPSEGNTLDTEAGAKLLANALKAVETEMGFVPVIAEVGSAVRRIEEARTSVELLAPDDVATAANRLLSLTTTVLTRRSSAQTDAYQRWRRAHRQFCDLARADLNVVRRQANADDREHNGGDR